jgi:hypothetical protein
MLMSGESFSELLCDLEGAGMCSREERGRVETVFV